MKQIIYIVLSFCFAFCFNEAVCQQGYILQSSYGGNYGEEVAGVIPNALNDLIIVGPSSSFPNTPPIGINAQFYITKISEAGNQDWGVVEGDLSELDIPYSAIKTYDNNYLAVGYASYQGSLNQIPGDIRLLKVDEAGSIIYSKLIEYGRVTSEAHDICYTDDGNYMIAGARIDSFAWKHYPLLTKIDENGDVIWAKDYKQDTIVAIYRVRQAPDGGYFAVGQGTTYSSFLLRYTEDGEVIWWRDLRGIGLFYDGIETIYDLEVNSSGNPVLIVNGHFNGFNAFECVNQAAEFSYILEMNSNGGVVQRKIYCSTDQGPVVFNDMLITADGGLLLSLRTGILKLNADWNTEWQLDDIFDNSNNYHIKKVGQFEDNSFYAVGELGVGNNNTDYFIVRISQDGVNAVTTISGGKELLLYPNPLYLNSVTAQLTLETTLHSATPLQTEIRNLQGQLVYSHTENAAAGMYKKTIELNLAAGMYYLMLQSSEGRVTKKVEVVR